MSSRRYWFASAVVLVSALAALAADDRYGDPIPEGAKARLGTARMRNAYGNAPTAATPDGKYLVASAPGGGVAYLDPTTGKAARNVRIDGAFGTPAGFSADGKRGVSSGYDSAFVWDTDSGKVIVKLTRPLSSGDNAVSLSADGKRLAVGGARRDKEKGTTAVVWDVDANKQLASVTPVQNETALVSLSPDGKRLATWGYHFDRDAKGPPDPANDPARQVQFWDATSGKETGKVRLPGYNPSAVVFAPDGSLAAASSGDGAVYLFDPASGASKGILLGRSRQGRKLAFSPDGKVIAAVGDDGSIQRWSVADGKRLAITEPPVPIPYGPRGMVFADKERVVAWGNRGMVTVAWDSPAGKLLTPQGGHSGGIRSAAVAAGGAEIYTGGEDGVIMRWNPANGQELGPIALKVPSTGFGGTGFGNAATLSPDGTRALVTDIGGGGLALYDLPGGAQQFVLPGDFNRDNRGTFTADGSKVVQVMGSYDVKKNPARVAVWDVAAAKKLGEVELPGVGYAAAALTPDGKTLVTAGTRQDEKGGNATFVVTGWELAGGKKLGEFTEPGGFGAAYVAAAGDNKSAVVATPKGPVAVIDVTTGKRTRDLKIERGEQPAAAPAVSPDGRTVAIVVRGGFGPDAAGTLLLIDIEGNTVKKTLKGVSGNPSVVVWSPDGKTVITGSYDTTALVWDVSK
jgi:WD40 repeat protein